MNVEKRATVYNFVIFFLYTEVKKKVSFYYKIISGLCLDLTKKKN